MSEILLAPEEHRLELDRSPRTSCDWRSPLPLASRLSERTCAKFGDLPPRQHPRRVPPEARHHPIVARRLRRGRRARRAAPWRSSGSSKARHSVRRAQAIKAHGVEPLEDVAVLPVLRGCARARSTKRWISSKPAMMRSSRGVRASPSASSRPRHQAPREGHRPRP